MDPVREYLQKIGAAGGRKGGPARARKLSKARRREIAKRASEARWKKAAASIPAATSVVLLLLLAGCSMRAMMVPVAGPLSELRPVPIIQPRVTGISGNSGGVEFAMQDGDGCRGRWSSAAGSSLTYGGATLLSTYGPVYISGFSVSTARRNPGQALVVCGSGRTMQLEFTTGAGTAHGFGIGQDNQGNLYRLVF